MPKTADFIVDRLRQWGIHRIFGYPGDGILSMLGALDRARGDPELIQPRHEAAKHADEILGKHTSAMTGHSASLQPIPPSTRRSAPACAPLFRASASSRQVLWYRQRRSVRSVIGGIHCQPAKVPGLPRRRQPCRHRPAGPMHDPSGTAGPNVLAHRLGSSRLPQRCHHHRDEQDRLRRRGLLSGQTTWTRSSSGCALIPPPPSRRKDLPPLRHRDKTAVDLPASDTTILRRAWSGRVEQFSRGSASADTTRASNHRRCGDRHSTSHQRRLARRPRGMRCRCRPGRRCRCPPR